MHLELHPSNPDELPAGVGVAVIIDEDGDIDAYCAAQRVTFRSVDRALRGAIETALRGRTFSTFA